MPSLFIIINTYIFEQLIFKIFVYLFIYSFLAVLGLCCYTWAFSGCSKWGLLSSRGARASHCGGVSCCGAQAPGHIGSVVAAHRLSCPVACETFPDQGSNPCPLHWQVDSSPVSHQGSPGLSFENPSRKPLGWGPVNESGLAIHSW